MPLQQSLKHRQNSQPLTAVSCYRLDPAVLLRWASNEWHRYTAWAAEHMAPLSTLARMVIHMTLWTCIFRPQYVLQSVAIQLATVVVLLRSVDLHSATAGA